MIFEAGMESSKEDLNLFLSCIRAYFNQGLLSQIKIWTIQVIWITGKNPISVVGNSFYYFFKFPNLLFINFVDYNAKITVA